MSNPTLSGQDLLDDLRTELGVLANAFTVDQQLLFLNKGVQEVWSIVQSLGLDYFADSTQNTDNTKDDFFVQLTTNVREYNLPTNCRELRFIECTTAGFEDRVFELRKFDDPLFAVARKQATAQGSSGGGGATSGSIIGNYYYAVFGNQIVLAQYPEATLTAKCWYIASIDNITDATTIPAILHPFNVKIVDYAAERAILSTQNESLSVSWMEEWKDSVKTLAMSVGGRSSTNPVFIADYTGQ
jgi:hypothetical protein